ncbi:DUF5958 family protein [Streptomyces goshikiensis]|uniref:DUF5958 family protein n=1 Tax=Streptomyces goshikiensis TaxID=1942 RepID=UPI0036AF4C67
MLSLPPGPCIQRGRPEAIRRSDLRPTPTSAVLVTHGSFFHRSPVSSRTAIRLLVAVLAIAAERRHARYCSDGCGHWWHDLYAAVPPRDRSE